MNPVGNPQHHVQPVCPRCGHLMVADSRDARADSGVDLQFRARIGNPPPPPRTLDVWRCTTCGIDRPRFQ